MYEGNDMRKYAAIMTGLFFGILMWCVLWSATTMEVVGICFMSLGSCYLSGAAFMAFTEPKVTYKPLPPRKFQIIDLKESEYVEIPCAGQNDRG